MSRSESNNPYNGDRWWETVVVDGIPPRPQGTAPSAQDSFDVIVVGGGASGHATAIFVADRGGTAVMLEAGTEGGGTAYKSGAGMWIPDNSLMRERGLGPDRDWAINHMAKLAHPDRYDPSAERLGLGEHEYNLIDAYYDSAALALDELRRLGLPVREFPSITGNYEAMVEYHSELEHGFGAHVCVALADGSYGGGFHLTAYLAQMASERGVGLRVRHRVTGLLRDADGAVVGVRAETPDGERELHARRGVVFATGGYPHNRELTDRFFPAPMFGSCAVPTARGDLIGIAEELGLPLGNMGCGWGTQHPLEMMLRNGGEVAEHIGVFPGDSVIMVNAAGRRVVNEKEIYHERAQVHYERAADGSFPNHLLFLVYDEYIAHESTVQPNRWPPPEPTNYWVISGDTLEELADALDARLASYGEQIGGVRLAPDFQEQLRATIERFNTFARNGVDEDFHRGETAVELDWTGPSHAENDGNPTMFPLADTGPYHAIIVAGSVLDTNGGPLAGPDGRLLDAAGETIPGLYGVGNCVASAAGEGYWSGGSTLGPAIAFAYLAAQRIVEEPLRQPGVRTAA